MSGSAVRVAVIGAGRWGPNMVRAILDDARCTVVGIADTDPDRLAAIGGRYAVPTASDPAVFIDAADVDAVIIATPAAAHAALVTAALLSGKHVLVEKPMATESFAAAELCRLARRQKRVLMVGHVFLYNGGFRELRKVVADSSFGPVRYMYARRLNLGPVRQDVHAGWDLASHDVSMFLSIKGCLPARVTASAQAIIRSDIPDVVFATLVFADGTLAHLHTSWLDPQKVRDVVVVGDNRMVAFDDMNLQEPVRIYHKSFERVSHDPEGRIVDTLGAFRVELRTGEIVVPPVGTGQPLATECSAFISAIAEGRPIESDGEFGLGVVRVLEAIDRSIAGGSRMEPVETS